MIYQILSMITDKGAPVRILPARYGIVRGNEIKIIFQKDFKQALTVKPI